MTLKKSIALLSALIMFAVLIAGCAPAPTGGYAELPVAGGTETSAAQQEETPSPAAETQFLPVVTPNGTDELLPTSAPTQEPTPAPTPCPVSEDGQYDSKDEVALYIHLFGHLPSNYIKKNDARALGWEGGSLEPYAPGCSIGGDRFGNYEGLLPTKSGRYYTECDIGTRGKSSRGSKRIVFSNDGLIYYTGDHYDTFTLLYGEEG